MTARPSHAQLFVAFAAAALGVQACKSSVDPNQGRFTCASVADCGAGYDCIAQFGGGAFCFPVGACDGGEVCDGVDQNCDGRVDETFPEMNQACTTGRSGVCSPGTRVCADAGLACRQNVDAGPEECNGLDDDCDAVVDNGFDLQTDSANCGACGNACPGGAGSQCRAGLCAERNCLDGLDNNQDGGADCEDPSCLAATCSADGLYNCGRLDADAGTPDGGAADGGAPDGGAADGGDPDGGADAGLPAAFCVPKESACDNGADDDGDGAADCADPDCDGKTCATGTVCALLLCPGAG